MSEKVRLPQSSALAATNFDLSKRSESQSLSFDGATSTMEELSANLQQNSRNASHASTIAVDTAELARKGGKAVDEVVETMGAIKESSRRVADVISVIDGIALQTNFLALSAAVEAARAGEHGRGFAAVASEVRTLAQRSAMAAKEIQELIAESVEEVSRGSVRVSTAGQTISEVVASVRKVADIMEEIAIATQEQSDGITSVNAAISKMDEETRQSAALMVEAASVADTVFNQSQFLARLAALPRLAGTPFELNRTSEVSEPGATPSADKTDAQLEDSPLPLSSIPATESREKPDQERD